MIRLRGIMEIGAIDLSFGAKTILLIQHKPVLKYEPINFSINSGCHSFQMKFKLRDASDQVEANLKA